MRDLEIHYYAGSNRDTLVEANIKTRHLQIDADSISFVVDTELDALRAAYMYDDAKIYPAPNVGGWLVNVFKKGA